MAIHEHPGYLGVTSRGTIAIHADWPTYPLDHGVEVALVSLGSFPAGTTFSIASDIDRCVLLIANEFLSNSRDLLDERNFHVAIWHEDMLAAKDAGFILGVEGLTEREHEQRKRDDLRAEFAKHWMVSGRPLPSGDLFDHFGWLDDERVFHPLSAEMPGLDSFDHDEDEDDLWADRSWLGTTGDPIQMTTSGWQDLERLWSETLQIPEIARSRIEPLVVDRRFDTALRELGAVLETQMRAYAGLDHTHYGIKLVDTFIAKFQAEGAHLGSGMKMLRGELRTAMKFVRNEFAHRAVDLSAGQGIALLSRMCHVLHEVEGFKPDEAAGITDLVIDLLPKAAD